MSLSIILFILIFEKSVDLVPYKFISIDSNNKESVQIFLAFVVCSRTIKNITFTRCAVIVGLCIRDQLHFFANISISDIC